MYSGWITAPIIEGVSSQDLLKRLGVTVLTKTINDSGKEVFEVELEDEVLDALDDYWMNPFTWGLLPTGGAA